MPPIDYSKWDNIDTDSEPEASPQQAPAANPPAAHACLAADGYIRFEGNAQQAEKRKFPFGLPLQSLRIMSCLVGAVRPRLIEVPLVLDRTGTQSVNEADLDNQIATYLNIDANSGFAPPDWQSQVGTVVVARKEAILSASRRSVDVLRPYPGPVRGRRRAAEVALQPPGVRGMVGKLL
ncbi:uncharacterized protein HRG_11289 [Hirsutella rhossiliensis]|uniref:Uncharacterized protein n=1 Tax=Hirsutella rhossiliensis TaxID=111463 RepID=A0A9P8SCM7_9HYPO|nr:uncharacterized protein HRG_11289 [Hirsutella rhossiliensis]KAH0957798.1 hypothetical protein HRG_11289 [Hirsutella rhossiliensis]